MATVKISGLTAGTPLVSDIYPGVDTTDSTQAPTGTTKKYNLIELIKDATYKAFCVSVSNLNATYNNGAGTLTNNGSFTTLSIDSVFPQVGDNVLVTGQSSTFQNGIYVVTVVGDDATPWVLTRINMYSNSDSIVPGILVGVYSGTIYGKTAWIQTATVTTVGTDAISFSQLDIAGTGLSKVQNSISITSPIPLSLGGTNNASIVASNGGIVYSNATQFALLAGTATAGRMLQSGASAAPTWSTPTYPSASGASGKILASDGTNIVYTTATFPVTAGAAGTILRSDGTNWVASTAVFANTYAVSSILYSNGSSNVAGLATANNGVLITSGAGVPSISSTLPTAVQANITQVGTIATGVWQGTPVGTLYGGTGSALTISQGDILYGSASNTISNLAKNTSATRYLSNTGASNNPAWAQIDLTNGVTGNLPLANGGTNASLTADNGGIVYSNASALAILASTSTAGKILQSGASAAPSWSAATYPSTVATAGKIIRSDGSNNVYSTSTFADTYSQGTILYAGTANTVTGLAPTASAVLVTNSSSVPVWTSTMTNGQVVIGSTGSTPVAANLTAGTGISITNGAGSITIAATGSGETWTEVTGTSQAMAVDNGYIANNVGLVTLTLPVTAALGATFEVVGKGAGGWRIAYNSGQSIIFDNLTSTVTTGHIDSTATNNCVTLVCTTANTVFTVKGSIGTISIS